jgi:ribonuclease P protein component
VKHTIKSTDEISSLFKTARKITTANFMALVAEIDEDRGPRGRVAFIAGKRLGNAPRRNRAKRLMREAAQRAGMPQHGVDVAFVAREQTADATLDMIVRDMKRVCQNLTQRAMRHSAGTGKGSGNENTGVYTGNP